jgi:intein/homing endonuclease
MNCEFMKTMLVVQMKPLASYSQNNYKESNHVSFMVAILLPNYLWDLDESIKVHNFHKVLREVHDKSGKTIRAVAREIGVHEVTYSVYLSGENKPNLKTLKKLSSIYSFDFLQHAFDNGFAFTSRKRAIQLPRFLTTDLAYYVGYLQGDGYIRKGKGSIGFCDEYIEQCKRINKLTKKLFGINGHIYHQKSRISKFGCYQLVVNSNVLSSLFHDFFGIIKGIKTELRVPKIMYSNKELLKWYISGLYDADGTLPKKPDLHKTFFIDITMKDKRFMIEIKNMLGSFGVPTLKLYERIARFPTGSGISSTWEVRIRKRSDVLKFLQTIGFHHPDKSKRQEKLISLLT